jgi:hypothetical protein
MDGIPMDLVEINRLGGFHFCQYATSVFRNSAWIIPDTQPKVQRIKTPGTDTAGSGEHPMAQLGISLEKLKFKNLNAYTFP